MKRISFLLALSAVFVGTTRAQTEFGKLNGAAYRIEPGISGVPCSLFTPTYDALVSPSVPSNYALLARTAGAGDSFVVQYVKRDGHCNIKAEEIERGFAELRQWKSSGKMPSAGVHK